MGNEAVLEFVHGAGGQVHATGGVGKRLLEGGMSANALRPMVGIHANAILRKDEWKVYDEEVVRVAESRLTGVADLVSRGLTYPLANGLATTVLEYETQTSIEAAQLDMIGMAKGPNDVPEFSIAYLPLPICHKDFFINARKLASSRTTGEALDTTTAGLASFKVSEKIEEILFTGASAYTFGGGTIRGYIDHPLRETGSLTANWDDSSAVALTDTIAMKAKLLAVKQYGPYIVYVPANFEAALDEDYVSTTSTTITVRERLEKIGGVEAVKVSDKLTANNVIMVQIQPQTIRMVIGMQPTTVEWQTEGGMLFHYKVMAIMVPQLRPDSDDNLGVCHYT